MVDKKVNIFGLSYDNLTLDEAARRMEDFIKEGTPHIVFTTGAELVARAYKDNELKKAYQDADLLTVDSHIVYFASRLLGKPIKESVSAARLMFRFLELTAGKGYRLYFLGAKEEVLKKAVENLKEQYPNLNVVGYHHGYFNFEENSEVVQGIVEAKPHVLFVAMSSPLKEMFISKNLEKMEVPVSFGVGGTIDIAAGYCKFAPQWVSKMGIEWVYRFIQEPARLWKRYATTNLIFSWLVFKEFFVNFKKTLRELRLGR